LPCDDAGRLCCKDGQGVCITVDRFDLVTAFGQQQGVPAVATRKIEHGSPFPDQRQEAPNPV
jgi:hypothetical protein